MTRVKHVDQARLVAVKIRKTKANGWMPDFLYVQLDGEPGQRGCPLVSGWSIAPTELWPRDRLKRYLPKLKLLWAEEFGKSWVLEIRS